MTETSNQSSIKDLKQKSRAKKLAVVLSCKGRHLESHLQALKQQDLSLESWFPVFLFWEKTVTKKQSQPFLLLIQKYFPDSPILFLDKDQPCYELRNLAFKYLDSPLLYFLDEDVLLKDPGHLSRLVQAHKAQPEVTVIGGSYLPDPDCSFWGQVYNFVVALWMHRWRSREDQDFLPAGNLSVKNRGFRSRFYSPAGFGGEEIFFLKSLHKQGFSSLWLKQLDAPHRAQHRFKEWLSRSWLHGKALANRPPIIFYQSLRLFLKPPACWTVKFWALVYLLLGRFSFILRLLKQRLLGQRLKKKI